MGDNIDVIELLEALGRRVDAVEGRQSSTAESISELGHSVVDLGRRVADLETDTNT